ncbi:Abi family protein [Xanthomonas axonopodis pv. begoniae]|nr:Abi family protein [Xanthomonas axonopodis pv. begoniae]MBO9773285.1 Abi family protein [Xanthomonas axonopodis pv. begoniae]
MEEEEKLAAMAALVSAERLATFVQISGSERDALSLHDMTVSIASALVPVLCLVEISLRNAVSERLRTVFATPDWLTQPPPPFAWRSSEADKVKEAKRQAQRASYAKLTDSSRKALDATAFPNGIPNGLKYENRIKRRQAILPITHGQLVAQLTMFFWKRIFSNDYENTLWKRGLKTLFPNKAIKRGDVASHLEVIYQARNRLAHHEPIYGGRLKELIESLDFIVANLGNAHGDESSVLAQLTSQYREKLKQTAKDSDILFGTFVLSSGTPS